MWKGSDEMGKRSERRRRQARAAAKTADPVQDSSAARRKVFADIRRGVVALALTPTDREAFGLPPADAPRLADPTVEDLLAPVTVVGTGFMVDDAGVLLTAGHVVTPFLSNLQQHAEGLI
jgi:hypothetical protein